MPARLFYSVVIILLLGFFSPGQTFSFDSAKGVPTAVVPSQETIVCVREGNSLLVPVAVNGFQILMLFDTGAENLTINKTTLSEIGMSVPAQSAASEIEGIGSLHVRTSRVEARVQLGKRVEEKFPINVLDENLYHPIIGMNFFGNSAVQVDVVHSRIIVSRGATDAKAISHVDIYRCARQPLIPVTINGCATRMLVDSGADGITFNQEQAASLHLIVPNDARIEKHMGVAGVIRGFGFTIDEIVVGSFVKRKIKVSVIESPGMPYPLLGADFFKDCIYTIDREHSQLTIDRI